MESPLQSTDQERPNFAALCRELGVSPQTEYDLIARYRAATYDVRVTTERWSYDDDHWAVGFRALSTGVLAEGPDGPKFRRRRDV